MKSNFLLIIIGINSGSMRIILFCLTLKKCITEAYLFAWKSRKRGFVKHPIDWKHSSAIDYYTEEGKGLLELVRLDW